MSCNKANFMEHLAHNGNWQSIDIKPVDQAAHQVAIERKERNRSADYGSPSMAAALDTNWMREHRIMDQYARLNTERGSMTKRPGDACEHY